MPEYRVQLLRKVPNTNTWWTEVNTIEFKAGSDIDATECIAGLIPDDSITKQRKRKPRMKTLTATQSENRDGMWHFMCPLHEPAYVFTEPSSMAIAIETLKSHMDDKHSGEKVRLMVKGNYTLHSVYSAVSVVETKGDFL
jgi:hypothetical protein